MIPIKNIYYMLTYAFKVLNEIEYKNLETEDFYSASDLYAAILISGVSLQLKRGLKKEYIEIKENTSGIKGKVNISESIKSFSMINRKMTCVYDEYSVDTEMNRILKTTMIYLLKQDVQSERKKKLKIILRFFSDVGVINNNDISWNLNFHRNNQSYKLLLNICKAVVNGILQTKDSGNNKMMEFNDNQAMSRLYETFLFNYYKKEFKDIKVSSPYIYWQLDDEYNELLPVMRTDLMLSRDNKILIIDAKYYSSMTQTYYDKSTNHSKNLYQMFSYVKNKKEQLANSKYEVSGLVLYAQTDEKVVPNNSYSMSGNRISIMALDLNCDFSEIKKQLCEIIDNI